MTHEAFLRGLRLAPGIADRKCTTGNAELTGRYSDLDKAAL